MMMSEGSIQIRCSESLYADVETCSPRHCSQELPMPESHYNSSSSLDMLSYCNEDCQNILCISGGLYFIEHPLLGYMEELKQSIVDMGALPSNG